ncbi:MAG: ATP synthase F0 subunit B [Clostridia bacterium]|nr:ATP synthase F0 subunit B [Clostridia bacterium]
MNLPLNIDLRQILLHMLNFVILAFGMYFILYKPVKEFMEKRRKIYETTDKEAKENLAKADSLKKEYEEKLSFADEEIKKSREQSELQANSDAAKIIAKAQKEAEDILNKSKKQAEYESKEALQRANREISEITVAAAKKVVYKDTREAFDAFLESAKGDADGGK